MLSSRIDEFIQQNGSNDKISILRACHQALMEAYPELHLRWCRIYGRRWSYIFGNKEEISYSPLQIKLSSDYGLFIDNASFLSRETVDQITVILKRYFHD